MTRLKLGNIIPEKPVRLNVEMPAQLHRDLLAYAELLVRQTGENAVTPAKLVPPMVEQFMASDRGFAKARQTLVQSNKASSLP